MPDLKVSSKHLFIVCNCLVLLCILLLYCVGLYLPLFWEQSFCIKSPIALGYTRGHFSALVPMEQYARIDLRRDEPEDVTYLPLMDCDSKLIPIHFLTQTEVINHQLIFVIV